MLLPITALFTGILILWCAYLSLKISFARGEQKVSLGEGESGSTLQRMVRVHGNAAEYVPVFLIMLALLEFHNLRESVLYVLGALFVIGRFLHRGALLRGSVSRRIWAMQLTLWPLILGALILMYTWFTHTFLL